MDAFLSIIICTYVRTHRLIECLRSIEEQSLDPSRFEVIVVSKGLAGKNEKRLDEFIKTTRLTIRHICEEHPGLSVARNAGLKKAKGRIIHFLDDDTLVTRECLQSYIDLFESTDALCAGGRILPRFITPPPCWLSENHWAFLGTLDLGEEICSFNYPANYPVGANVAFRREAFNRFGHFDEELGIHGRKTVGGEETDLCYRIQTAGEKLLYCPKALVYHCIETDKLSRRWMRRTAYRQGKGSAMLQLKHSSTLTVLRSNLLSLLQREKHAGEPITKRHEQSACQQVSYLETKIALALGYAVQMGKALLK